MVSGTADIAVGDQVLTYLTTARWFGGKGRRAELRSVTPLPWLSEPGRPGVPAVRFEVAEIGYPSEPNATVEYYQLAVVYRDTPVPEVAHAAIGRLEQGHAEPLFGYDAMQDPQACRLILAALLDARELAAADDRVTFRLREAEGLSVDVEPKIFTGQQSNTSVMFGDVAMIKFFRRLELGRNLDIEVHDALNNAGVHDVARLFGWIEGQWRANSESAPYEADLAMVVEKLAGARDGWELALQTIPQPGVSNQGFEQHAHALGAALAETHAALRSAFPTAELSGDGVAAVMAERLDRAAAIASGLQPYVEGVSRSFADLHSVPLEVQRVHGDFHLGQTLHTPTGWKIIDFEGEPVKTLAERSAPDSVWRDVAGMLRSFDYAAASVPGPDSAQWAADARAAFLTGYAGGPLAAGDAAIVRAYEADKAIYEVVYEVRNRPDWVSIPLSAVATLADQTDQQEQ